MRDPKHAQLVLLRHGESEWNKLNLFTGWRDVKLTGLGEAEADEAGQLMAGAGLAFDIAFTSMQTRAIHTMWLALKAMNRMWIPDVGHWRLNERHYGALTGQNKKEAVEQYGEEQVHQWRRSFDVPPPPVALSSADYPGNDKRYAHVRAEALPRGECLKDVLARALPFWDDRIVPELLAGKQVLVVAHGNSLRALLKHLEGVPDAQISDINIPTGVPKIYHLDSQLKAVGTQYLGDADDVAAKIAGVKAQTGKA